MTPPDVEYTKSVNGRAHVRVEIGVTDGDVDWFLVQLEYNMQPHGFHDNDWEEVARFDHHPHEPHGHDHTIERLHLDIYKNGQKHDVKRGFPPVPENEAPAKCEEFLLEHADYYIGQFERWHDISFRTVIE